MNSNSLPRPYYPALDGLRGIAILLVICCHNFNFIPYFKFGWMGVDLFFVLSGFLITDILLRAKGSKNFLQNFYLRRVLRIFPLYYGVLLLFFLIAPSLEKLQVQYGYYQSDQAMLWLHLQNWMCIIHIRPIDSMLLTHFWSLSLEEQFYLIWPVIILFINNTRILTWVACLILAICIAGRFMSWFYFGVGNTNFYFQYMTRVDGLCVGSLIAIWRLNSYEQIRKKIMTLAIVLFGSHIVLVILSKTIFPGFPHFTFMGFSSVAALFGIITFALIEKRNSFTRALLENKAIKFFGRISYGLYVYHWPLLALGRIYLLDELTSKGYSFDTSNVLVSIVTLIAAITVSILSFYFFEKKVLALKDIITAEGFFARVRKKLRLIFNLSSTR